MKRLNTRFNKGVAAVIGSSASAVIAAFFPELGEEVLGAITVLLTSGLVFIAPANKAPAE